MPNSVFLSLSEVEGRTMVVRCAGWLVLVGWLRSLI